MAPKYMSKLSRSQPPCSHRSIFESWPNSFVHCRHSCSVPASMCIYTHSRTVPSKLTQSSPSSICPKSLNHGLQVHSIMAAKYVSTLSRSQPAHLHVHCIQTCLLTQLIIASHFIWSWPPSSIPNSMDHGHQVRMVMASKCISKLSLSQPPNMHDHGLQVYPQPPLITSSKFTLPWPAIASPNSHDHSFQVRTVMASKFISKLTQSCPPSLHNHCLEMHLETCSIMPSKYLAALTWSWPAGASLNSHYHSLHPCAFSNSLIHSLQQHLWVDSYCICRCYSDCVHILSAAGLTTCISIEQFRMIINAILWCSESSCDCNKDEYEQWNDLWLLVYKTNYCEHTARSFPHSYIEASSADHEVSCRPAKRPQLVG